MPASAAARSRSVPCGLIRFGISLKRTSSWTIAASRSASKSPTAENSSSSIIQLWLHNQSYMTTISCSGRSCWPRCSTARSLARLRGEHPELRYSHGFVFQQLVEGPRAVGEVAENLGVTSQAVSKAARELDGPRVRRAHAGSGRCPRPAIGAHRARPCRGRGEPSGPRGAQPRAGRRAGRRARGRPPPARCATRSPHAVRCLRCAPAGYRRLWGEDPRTAQDRLAAGR